jgi:hypothetical protein
MPDSPNAEQVNDELNEALSALPATDRKYPAWMAYIQAMGEAAEAHPGGVAAWQRDNPTLWPALLALHNAMLGNAEGERMFESIQELFDEGPPDEGQGRADG